MIQIHCEKDSPKDVDFKLIQKGLDGLYPFTHLFIEIVDHFITNDSRYTQIKGLPFVIYQKEKQRELLRLWKNIIDLIKEYEWPEDEFAAILTRISEKRFEIHDDLKKLTFRGSPPKLRNAISLYWAQRMRLKGSRIDWGLVADLLEWLHCRFRGSVWREFIKSNREEKAGDHVEVESLIKYFQRNKSKYIREFPSPDLEELYKGFGISSLIFNIKKRFIDGDVIGLTEVAHRSGHTNRRGSSKFEVRPIQFMGGAIYFRKSNPLLLRFPDGSELHLMDHIDNLAKDSKQRS